MSLVPTAVVYENGAIMLLTAVHYASIIMLLCFLTTFMLAQA